MSAIPASTAEEAPNTESRGSLTPLLPGAFPTPAQPSGPTDGTSRAPQPTESVEAQNKPRKRDFWRLGKKKEDDTVNISSKSPELSSMSSSAPRASASHIAPITALRPSSPLRGSVSPQRGHPYGAPASPGHGVYSSSPRLHSPASSQIFERDVQEDVVQSQTSPQIPSHIITENHIPPALDATSEAITNKKLDPDSVEIVTHATHQPAAVTIVGNGAEPTIANSLHDELSARQDTDNASNYGSLDTSDVRRLSFISFADVVHAEHAGHVDNEQRRDSAAHATGLISNSALSVPRSPSPLRQPVSGQPRSTSPPTNMSPSLQPTTETPPGYGYRTTGSPPPGQPGPLGGELNIETMRQALRKTGSGDLSGFRSAPMSVIGDDEGKGLAEKSLR